MNYAEFIEIININSWTLSRSVKHCLVGAIYYENRIKRAMKSGKEINVISIRTFSDFKMKRIEEAFKLAKFEAELGTDIYDKNLEKLIVSVASERPELSELLMLNMKLAEAYRKDQQIEREYESKDSEFKQLYDSVHGVMT